ncbi:MAG: outer membrane beta-barrel protein [Acidobacteriota bacterium]
MKFASIVTLCLFAAAPALRAQTWEVGGAAGVGFYNGRSIERPTESAQAKIKTGIEGSAWFANNNSRYWGGEIRYDYQRGNLGLKQGGTQATFGAESHAIHYDFLWHTSEIGSTVRSYIAFGAGVKIYRGTGTEALTQPLSRFALLTKTNELKGMISVGAGVKWKLGHSAQLRVDIHDYITQFPKEVITPNTGAKIGGWINDIVPTVGISWAK